MSASDPYETRSLEEEILFIQGLNHNTGRRVGLYTEIKQPTFHRQEGHDAARIVIGILARHTQVHSGVVCAHNLPMNRPSLGALHEALFVAPGAEGGFTDPLELTFQWLKYHKRR